LLQQLFAKTAQCYSSDAALIADCWSQIEKQHNEPTRHYHTLHHLRDLILKLEKVKSEIDDWDAIIFATFYHDFIYTVTQNDNEMLSAEAARGHLTQLGFPASRIIRVEKHILATRQHAVSVDSDTNFFNDADLAILGADENVYLAYTRQVREEFQVYPDAIFNAGRKKILQDILAMEKIFKTAYFFAHFEKSARQNLSKEMLVL